MSVFRTAPTGARQLQRDLLLRLMLPMLAIVSITGLLGIYGAEQHVERTYDRWLIDAAESVTTQVSVKKGQASIDLTPQAQALIAYDNVDRISFEVIQGDRHLTGLVGIPLQGDDEHQYRSIARAYDGVLSGSAVRIARVDLPTAGGADVIVLVAETLGKRRSTRSELFFTMTPAIALVLLTALVIGFVVRRTFGALGRIATRLDNHSHHSLEPIELDDVPKELLPFAITVNDLLARVSETLARERRFGSTVAHQLRTPLTALRLGLARAAEATDVDSMRALLQELDSAAQRTGRLVQQLLALARLEPEAHQALHRRHVDLVALSREIGESFQSTATGKKIELELVSDVESCVILAEPDLLTEALGNVIDNAIRHTPVGGRILMTVISNPPTIEVGDSGSGMAEDERVIMVERFRRGRAAVGDGSGLGLAIVKEIAELHGATIHLGSSSLGGASISIRFAAELWTKAQLQ